MWKQRVLSILQKGSARGRGGRNYHHGGSASGMNSASARLLVGASISLVVLSQLDQRNVTVEENGKETATDQGNKDSEVSSEAMAALASLLPSLPPVHKAATTSCDFSQTTAFLGRKKTTEKAFSLQRWQTLRQMEAGSTMETLESRYDVQWKTPIGEGSFGTVYIAKDKLSGELVALKKIPKKYTKEKQFLGEMNALLHLRQAGGHPGICALRDHFNESGHYYLALDLIEGGELFDHLVEQGAYSELDASRLVREVASSLAFIHGLGMTHADLKPENLMLSSKNPSDAVIKLVDFGCSHVAPPKEAEDIVSRPISLVGKTLAYSPPEILNDETRRIMQKLDPSLDMWALGIILYIMLTGVHPYDLNGQATDEEVAAAVISGRSPPIRNSPITAHLSDSAIDLIEKLICRDPKKRLDAYQMLEHDWVKGLTASKAKMVGSDKKLSYLRKHKSRIQAKVFENLVNASVGATFDDEKFDRRRSLVEQSFRMFDLDSKGHISAKDLHKLGASEDHAGELESLSLSGFSDLLAENMIDAYFPPGHVVYREGDLGNHMYFINSGTVSVETCTGFRATRSGGDLFGEGALLNPKKTRSATIRCLTPVHAMQINREYFEKFLAESDPALFLELREKDKIRKRNRTRIIMRLQENLIEKEYRNGEFLFREGEDGDSLYLVEEGKVDVEADEKKVLVAAPGNVIGEHAMLTGQPRNCTAICNEKTGCLVYQLMGNDVRKLMAIAPYIKTTLTEMCIRRDFKKAVVLRLKKGFPYNNPREGFDAIKVGDSEFLDADSVGPLMRMLHPYTDAEIDEIMSTIDLNHSGSISYEEFKKVFIADKRGSASL